MALLKICIHKIFFKKPSCGGFTLIEILIVIGIVAALAAASLFAGVSDYRGVAFRAEKSTMISLLQKARADALNNIDEMPHGVAFFPPDYPQSYVLFEGATYAASAPASRVAVNGAYAVVLGGGDPQEVVFSQLSGNANWAGDIVLTDRTRGTVATITINHEGAIIY